MTRISDPNICGISIENIMSNEIFMPNLRQSFVVLYFQETIIYDCYT